jgi:Flp pilus assembly CpaF family ATPase
MASEADKVQKLLSSALGSGVTDLLKDPAVSEIRLNSDGKLWASRLGEGLLISSLAPIARSRPYSPSPIV